MTKLWNKEGVHKVGILFEYRDKKAYVACQSLLEKHYIPLVKTFITKEIYNRVNLIKYNGAWDLVSVSLWVIDWLIKVFNH